jgi:hypothetical protein
MRSIYLQSFMLIPLVVSKLCPGQEKGTDGKTDGWTRRRLYAPPKFFGEHKKLSHYNQSCSLHSILLDFVEYPLTVYTVLYQCGQIYLLVCCSQCLFVPEQSLLLYWKQWLENNWDLNTGTLYLLSLSAYIYNWNQIVIK